LALDVTLVLRRRNPLVWPLLLPPRTAFATRYGADPADVARLRDLGLRYGMQERACDVACRTLHWRGTVTALQQAFGVRLGRFQLTPGGAPFVGSMTAPTLPDPALLAVLGLDQRPVAHPHFRVALGSPTASYTPLQVGVLYAFPPGDGSGQTVAIIELGGGYRQADLDTYFRGLGLPTPSISAVGVDGGSNQPGSDADAEVLLDLEVAGALAPAATFAAYFAPNTDQGFYNAIAQAAHNGTPHPTVMSISWGGPEDSWSAASRAAMESALEDAAALGVTVCVASGDRGSGDGESGSAAHVDYPASSVSVLACGGTKLLSGGGKISSEVVWNEAAGGEGAGGGGVSAALPRPAWQDASGVPKAPGGFVGRGVPDVAGNADPLTGYQVLVDGKAEVVGGTSAVAPLWAALVARLNQQLAAPLGLANAALYGTGAAVWRDITQGNNGAYRAGPGWDACTGLGSPKGQALLTALQSDPGKPKPKPKPKPSRTGGGRT
jgi:kumamolisin